MRITCGVVAAVLVSACATTPKRQPLKPVRNDGPRATVAVQTNRYVPNESVAQFALVRSGYAVLAQVKDGRVRILFPDADNPTARVRGSHNYEAYVDTTGPIFLVAAAEPMQLSGLRADTLFIEWGSTHVTAASPADSVITRFATAVAGSDVTILRAEPRLGPYQRGTYYSPDAGKGPRCRLAPPRDTLHGRTPVINCGESWP